jgi:hypothetical protein
MVCEATGKTISHSYAHHEAGSGGAWQRAAAAITQRSAGRGVQLGPPTSRTLFPEQVSDPLGGLAGAP